MWIQSQDQQNLMHLATCFSQLTTLHLETVHRKIWMPAFAGMTHFFILLVCLTIAVMRKLPPEGGGFTTPSGDNKLLQLQHVMATWHNL